MLKRQDEIERNIAKQREKEIKIDKQIEMEKES